MEGRCDFIIPRPPGELPRRFLTDEERAASKASPAGKPCGAKATKKTLVNEDPWGAGEWCAPHAPPVAVPIEPPDPNKGMTPPPIKKPRA